jgi:aspartate/methionine/tyrosine aminotransferase
MMRRSGARLSLTMQTMSRRVINADYAIRGTILKRAQAIKAELQEGSSKYNFGDVVFCHNGNPQAYGQKHLTFPREVLALVACPTLLDKKDVGSHFAPDAIARAKSILADQKAEGCSSGSYTESQGYSFVRAHVAEFIEARDGAQCGKVSKDDIYLTDGASDAASFVMQALLSSSDEGIMVPVPQYPLFSATCSLLDGSIAPYYLDEQDNWSTSRKALDFAYLSSKANGVKPRALIAINPGNPTGHVYDVETMQTIIELCSTRDLVLVADEVYQGNIYNGTKFKSFREVLCGMGDACKNVQLVSLHSVSKGVFSECGRRGGYLHMMNVDAAAQEQFCKVPAVHLCPNVGGQVAMDLVAKPPVAGDASYATYVKEHDAIAKWQKHRAEELATELNDIDGISCTPADGSMFVFPRLHLPARFVEDTLTNNVKSNPDVRWCRMLLEEEGVCVIPGSGFMEQEHTYHFRASILPKNIADTTSRIRNFQERFIERYK